MGMASYSASVGFGIASIAVGGILTFTRIFDHSGKPNADWLIMVLSVLMMFDWAAGKGDMDISPMIIPLSMVTTIVWLATC